MFDADGSVQGTSRSGVSIRLAQSDLSRLKAVQRMLLRLGIFSKIYLNRRPAGKRPLPDGHGGYKMYNIKAQHELDISCQNLCTFMKRVGFENIDKAQKYRRLFSQYSRKPVREKFIVSVSKSVSLGQAPVYDIQVPGINAFDANGFYIHNCGELPLYPFGSCNLGSINLWAFCKAKPTNGKEKDVQLDWPALAEAVRIATRFLDNVVDINKYPLPEIENVTLSMRKIGLGLMGLADTLYDLGLAYNSPEGLRFMSQAMEFLNFHSKVASVKLAKERGEFPLYRESFYPEGRLPFSGREKAKGGLPLEEADSLKLNWPGLEKAIAQYGLRNAQTTTNAPTGSVSMIAGASSGIEPNFSLVTKKRFLSAVFIMSILFLKK